MSIYQFTAELNNGEEKKLSDYKGKVILIVNTATKCGFASQLQELQALQDKFKQAGFTVLGFPCNQFMNQEPGTDSEIAEVCSLQFGVSFPIFKKVDVKGANAHPLFTYLTSRTKGMITSDIKWNFTKFLIDQNGRIIDRYAPATKPQKIEESVKKLLNSD